MRPGVALSKCAPWRRPSASNDLPKAVRTYTAVEEACCLAVKSYEDVRLTMCDRQHTFPPSWS